MAVAAAAASALRGSRSWLRTAALPAAAQVRARTVCAVLSQCALVGAFLCTGCGSVRACRHSWHVHCTSSSNPCRDLPQVSAAPASRP